MIRTVHLRSSNHKNVIIALTIKNGIETILGIHQCLFFLNAKIDDVITNIPEIVPQVTVVQSCQDLTGALATSTIVHVNRARKQA